VELEELIIFTIERHFILDRRLFLTYDIMLVTYCLIMFTLFSSSAIGDRDIALCLAFLEQRDRAIAMNSITR